jgi:hypothetical protein
LWHYPEVADTTWLRRLSENKPDLRREGPESTLLTHQRHWLALRQVLMPVQPLSKYWFAPIQCCFLTLGKAMQRRKFITLIGGASPARTVKKRQGGT